MERAKSWSDLSDQQKTWSLIAASVHLALAATAWTDLAKRPPTKCEDRRPCGR